MDLVHWVPLGENLVENDPRAPLERVFELDPSSASGFFRCLRLIPDPQALTGARDLREAAFQGLHLQSGRLSFTLIHQADFSQSDLTGSQMFAVNGDRVRFDRAQMLGVDLTASVVLRSSFHETSLVGATVRFADFKESDFSEADLRFADFTGTDLFQSDLSGADLRGAVLSDADLRFAKLHGSRIDSLTILPPGARIAWSILNDSRRNRDFSESDLTGMLLTDADLRDIDLSGSILVAVDLQRADLRGADLSGVAHELLDLRGTQIDERTRFPLLLEFIWNMVNGKEEGLELGGLDFHEAVLTQAFLHKAQLRRANLSGAVMIRADLSQADLRDANLQGAFLNGADLRGANLKGALIQGTDFDQALFQDTIMPDGSVRNE